MVKMLGHLIDLCGRELERVLGSDANHLCSDRIRWQAKKGSRREKRKNQDFLHPFLAGKPQLSFETGLSYKKYSINSPYTP